MGYKYKDDAVKLASELANKNMIDPEQIHIVADEWVKDNEDLDSVKKAAKLSEKKPKYSSTWDGMIKSARADANPDQNLINWIVGS